ncbi:MAG: TIGR02530 family flagellar biosynthesis protein [Bdellovibrionales bacterium]
MDLKKLQSFESLVPPGQVGSVKPGGVQKPSGTSQGPSFKETLNGVLQEGVANPTTVAPTKTNLGEGVKFSNHALDRMRLRGIRFTPDDVGRLNEAVTKAAAKGSKDTLVLMNDAALIVSVKNKTVVTVMDKTALKENVFTNIDSTIVM